MNNPNLKSRSFVVFLKTLFKFALISKFGIIILLLICVIPFSAFEAHVADVTATIERRHCNKFDVYNVGHWNKHSKELTYFKKIGGIEIENNEQIVSILEYSGDAILERIKRELLVLKLNAEEKGVARAFVPGESNKISDLIIEADVLISGESSISEEVGREMYERILLVNSAGAVSTCETCPTGMAMIKSFDFSINGGAPVASLRDNVNVGDLVKANFTLAPGCEKQEFSLVAYSAPDYKFNPELAGLEKVFDFKTGFFDGGRNSMEVQVPGCSFDVAFVRGAVIEKLGPVGSDNFYSPQGRLIDSDNGDEDAKICLDLNELGGGAEVQSAAIIDSLPEAEEIKSEEEIQEKVGEGVVEEKKEEESAVDSNSINDPATEEPAPGEVVAPSAPVEVSKPTEQEPAPGEVVVETAPVAPQE